MGVFMMASGQMGSVLDSERYSTRIKATTKGIGLMTKDILKEGLLIRLVMDMYRHLMIVQTGEWFADEMHGKGRFYHADSVTFHPY
jgi:hypothetical protein